VIAKTQIRKIQNLIKKKQVALAELRDELRDLEAEIKGLGDSAEEALFSLENAVDRLSELV